LDTIYLTHEGLNKLRLELDRLVNRVRPQATRELKAARQKGDLSENAEYDAAREKLADIDRRIGVLQQQFSRIQILEEKDLQSEEVRILTRVRAKNINNGVEVDYTLVDSVQADPARRLISVKSPIARGLLGKKIGDIATIDTPSGKIELHIIAIERSEGI